MLTICCEKCGAGVSVDPDAMPKKLKCPQCHAKVKVPEGLAALPSPKLPGEAGGATAGAPAQAGGAGVGEAPVEESEVAVVMAKLMPWMVSACLHAAGFLMLALVTAAPAATAKKDGDGDGSGKAAVPEQSKKADLIKIPEKLIEGVPTKAEIKTGGMGTGTAKKVGGKRGRPGTKGWYGDPNETKTGRGWGHSTKVGAMNVYGGGSGGGGGAGGTDDFGMGKGAGGDGGGGFFGDGDGDGTGGNVRYVVYCIDHSGSVLPAFDEILEELKSSIGGLVEGQDFHVVFFAKDTWQESPARRLVPASDANKREALGFLKDIRAAGWGSSPIPAMKAAFSAFRDKPNKEGEGKLMYLLTDGDFETSGFKYKGLAGNEAVTAWLRENNADKSVHVFPIILGEKPTKETEESMRKIATENGGEYRLVERKN